MCVSVQRISRSRCSTGPDDRRVPVRRTEWAGVRPNVWCGLAGVVGGKKRRECGLEAVTQPRGRHPAGEAVGWGEGWFLAAACSRREWFGGPVQGPRGEASSGALERQPAPAGFAPVGRPSGREPCRLTARPSRAPRASSEQMRARRERSATRGRVCGLGLAVQGVPGAIPGGPCWQPRASRVVGERVPRSGMSEPLRGGVRAADPRQQEWHSATKNGSRRDNRLRLVPHNLLN